MWIKKQGLLLLCCLFLFFVFLMPLLGLVYTALHGSASLYGLLMGTRTLAAVRNTLSIAFCATLFSALAGTALAFLMAYTDLRAKACLEALILSLLAIPSYIIAISWSNLFADNGLFYSLPLTGYLPAIQMYSLGGIAFVMGICHIPIVYLTVVNALRRIPRSLEWAARVSGCSPRRVLYHINLPLAMPAIAAGSVLSFLASIDNFAIPAFLGISANLPVLSTYIYEKTISFGPSSFSTAAGLSIFLSLIAFAAILLQHHFTEKGAFYGNGREDFAIRIHMTKKRRLAAEFIAFGGMGLLTLLPFLSMAAVSLQKSEGLGFNAANLSLHHYGVLISYSEAWRSIGTSLFLSGSTALLCAVLGTLCAFCILRHHSRMACLLEDGASAYYAIPGIVIALAMIFYWGKVPYMYGSLGILLLAYSLRYLILSIKNSKTALLTLGPSLEEAARICGSSTLTRWRRILLPLLCRPMMAGALLIFVFALTEVSLSSLLASAGTKTIGLFIFNLQQGGEYNMSAAMSVIILLLLASLWLVIHLAASPVSKNRDFPGQPPRDC